MRKALILLLIVALTALPGAAVEFTAPEAPENVQDLVPREPETFGEGLWYVVKKALGKLQPALMEAAQTCLSVIAAVLLTSLLRAFPGGGKSVAELACTVCVAGILLKAAHSLIYLGTETVTQLSEYGKLLLPVMTAAMAAQGASITSAALYTGTAAFDALLGSLISTFLVPGIYIYLALSVANSAMGEEMLKKLRDFVKWLITWGLKIVLYVFTVYMGVTGVISGSADASALKVTKIAISGMVPVIGGMLSDASEAILVSAGIVKGAVGLYGLLAVLAIWIQPFLQIGAQYLLLKLTAAICGVFGTKQASDLIQDFSTAMGILLAMTGTMCLLLLISTVCFVKGVR